MNALNFTPATKLFKSVQHLVYLLLLIVSLSGCNKELYTDLNEKEGNDMLSVLLEQGIDAEKVSQKKGRLVSLMVNQDDMARAITLLKNKGFPRDRYTSVGELFKKDGLISSPLEERARYIYGLSQEIAETLSQLDGVITARVHVVMPESNDRKKLLESASASIFIKHTETAKLGDYIPQIKMLVNNSIEGLSYDNITVGLFPSLLDDSSSGIVMEKVLSISVAEHSVSRFYTIMTMISIILLGAVGANVYLIKKLKNKTQVIATVD
jgi:type III secretion protein J